MKDKEANKMMKEQKDLKKATLNENRLKEELAKRRVEMGV